MPDQPVSGPRVPFRQGGSGAAAAMRRPMRDACSERRRDYGRSSSMSSVFA